MSALKLRGLPFRFSRGLVTSAAFFFKSPVRGRRVGSMLREVVVGKVDFARRWFSGCVQFGD